MFIFPLNLYVEILTLKAMVLEGGEFQGSLDHEGKAFMNSWD